MNRTQSTAQLTALALLGSVVSAGALDIPLTVREVDKADRKPGMVTCGIPFARGAVKDTGRLCLSAGGKPVPAQFARTVAWDDGSVRWALLDCQATVPAGGSTDLVVSDSGGNVAPSQPVTVQESPDGVRVSTGPMEIRMPRGKGGLIESLRVDGKELITPAGRGVVLVGAEGGDVVGVPSEVALEQRGPMRVVVRVRGTFPDVHGGLLNFTARVSVFAGQKLVKIHLWIENEGSHGYTYATTDENGQTKPEWALFDGVNVELGLAIGETPVASCEGVEAADGLKVLQICHYSKTREQYPRRPYSPNDLEFTVASGTNVLARGLHSDGIVTVRGGNGAVTAAIRDFWQNYEKAIEVGGGKLNLWLWPREGQWPRARVRLDDMYDNTLAAMCKDGFYRLMGGAHKGHEMILDFSGRPAPETAAELSAPLFAFAPAAHYAGTEASIGLFAPPETRTGNRDCDFKLGAWERMMRNAANPSSSNSLFHAWGNVGDRMYSLGWMDYGDLVVPGHGPVSLHYDWVWIMLTSAMRTGDPNFMRLATTMARHRIDIDQLWSKREATDNCRGLQMGGCYGDFHSYRLYRPPGVGDNWLAGVALYYMMTGDPKALDSCRLNGESLKNAWKWVGDTKPYGGPQGSVMANAMGINTYCAMYALTADRSWLGEALDLFRRHIVPIRESRGPFLHDPMNQFRSQGYAKEDIQYCHSIGMLCELQHVTGDEQVMQVLKDGCAQEYPPAGYFEAPIFLSSLYGYVGWKTGDKEMLARAAELFAEGFPESKSPPCYIPDNSTWSWHSAMSLRSALVLQTAAWRTGK